MNQSFIFLNVNTYIFRTVYLIRRKRAAKPYVIKEEDLNATNYSSFEIYYYSTIWIISLPSRIDKFTYTSFMIDRVLEEVRCLQRMRHPNIVFYHEAWIGNNYNYILMEYATRCTLKDLLEKQIRHSRRKQLFVPHCAFCNIIISTIRNDILIRIGSTSTTLKQLLFMHILKMR